jgi:hypothetical protein
MLINEIYEVFRQMVNSQQSGGYFNATNFNNYCDYAQNAVINELSEIADYNQRVISLSSDVLKTATINVVDGIAALPSDYFIYLDANAMFYDNDAKKFEEYPADYVGKSERGERLRSKIVDPQSDYPIITEGFGGLLVEPSEVSRIKLTYYFQPDAPVWAGTDTVPPVFDPNTSTDFVLGDKFKNILVNKILSYAGIEIREPYLLQATTQSLIKPTGNPTN